MAIGDNKHLPRGNSSPVLPDLPICQEKLEVWLLRANFWFLKRLQRPNKIQASSLLCLLLKLILELHMQTHNILELGNSSINSGDEIMSLIWRKCANYINPQDCFSKDLTQQTQWTSRDNFAISRISSNSPWWLQIFLPALCLNHLICHSLPAWLYITHSTLPYFVFTR